ncbi:DnaJ domain-containing protein [bacterium]|nr:DnaJ domain-containing protein [bacterium]
MLKQAVPLGGEEVSEYRMAREDYYSILGVDRHAPEREIKRAYYNLARDLHPDKAKTPEEGRASAERLAVISKAYNTLKDPAKRAEYDAATASGSNQRASTAAVPRMTAPKPGAAPPSSPGVKGGKPSENSPAAAQASAVGASDLHAQRILVAQRAFVKGMEFWKSTDYKSALPFFQTAADNDPDSEPHYHMKLAVCLMKTRKSFMKAVEAAEKACQMDNYNMEFKFNLGEIYEAAGVLSKAKEVYEDILKWEPDNQKAKLKLGLLKDSIRGQQPESILAKVFPSIFGKK